MPKMKDDSDAEFKKYLKTEFDSLWAAELKKPEKERRDRQEVSKQAFAIASKVRTQAKDTHPKDAKGEKDKKDAKTESAELALLVEFGLPLFTVEPAFPETAIAMSDLTELHRLVFDEEAEFVEESVLEEKAKKMERRSLTEKEAAELKIPKADLKCSVMYFEGRGYAAYTHRARTKFHESPGSITVKELKFIESTG